MIELLKKEKDRLIFIAMPGDRIFESVDECLLVANSSNLDVFLEFNGETKRIYKELDTNLLISNWYKPEYDYLGESRNDKINQILNEK